LLHGLATVELRQEELEYHDPEYEVLLTAKAVKPGIETLTTDMRQSGSQRRVKQSSRTHSFFFTTALPTCPQIRGHWV